MFSWKVMTVLSSPRRLDLVLMPQNRNQRVTSAVTGRSLALLLVLDYWYGWGQDKTSQHVSLVPRPTLQGRRVWEITLLGAVQLECHGFWIQQTPLSDLQHDWSFTTPIFKISTFYRLFASMLLVELKRWLAGLTFFPSSTHVEAFRPSRHFRA